MIIIFSAISSAFIFVKSRLSIPRWAHWIIAILCALACAAVFIIMSKGKFQNLGILFFGTLSITSLLKVRKFSEKALKKRRQISDSINGTGKSQYIIILIYIIFIVIILTTDVELMPDI